MAAANRRDLFISVSGSTTGLAAAMKQGKSLLHEFGSDSVNVLQLVEQKLGEVGTGGLPGLKQAEQNFDATFRRIRENARSVLDAPSGQAAVQIVDANATREAAAAASQKAVAFRLVAEAATRADQAQNGQNAAVRAYAVAAAAAAVEAERESAALREQAAILGQVEGHLEATGAAQRRQVVVNGQARAGYQQLSFQLGDVATQYAAGTSASIIFAQQSGQVIQAIQLIAGEAKGLIGFLGGPWGVAISAALVALTPFVSKLFEGGDAAKTAEEASRDLARTVDDIGSFFDRTTGRIRETNKALVQFAILSRQRKVDELREGLQRNARTGAGILNDSHRNLKPVSVERGLGSQVAQTINFDVEQALKLPYERANAALRAIARSNSTNAAQAAQLLEERAKFARSVTDIARANAEIRSLEGGSLDSSLRDPAAPRVGGGGGGQRPGRGAGGRSSSGGRASAAPASASFEFNPTDLDRFFDPEETKDRARQAAERQRAAIAEIFGEVDPLAGVVDAYNAKQGETRAAQDRVLTEAAQRPLARYREELLAAVGDTDRALEGVKVDGLRSLEDGLLGVVDGTETVAGAFKKMASAIIADLARIAIQKAIVGALGSSFFGLAGGGAIGDLSGFAGGGTPGGRISGPGDGTSDSILAILGGGKGAIRVSNGEFIVNERATREHLPLLHLLNSGRLPRFAAGGAIDPAQIRLRSLPDFSSVQRGGGMPSLSISMPVDARGADPAALARFEAALAQAKAELPARVIEAYSNAKSRGVIR